jgi:chorismate lyase / 3-hydroxybenzoate synthase
MKEIRSSGLSVALVAEKDLKQFSSNGNNILAAIYYGKPILDPVSQDCLQVAVSLPQCEKEPLVEVWTSVLPHEVNRFENICYAANSDLVFGSITFQETKTDRLEQLAFRAYTEIFTFLDQIRFPLLVRCWNYFPNINQENNGIERYKLFCSGRHDAFAKKFQSLQPFLPAGSAVGSEYGPLTINFIATKNHSVTHIENPRQVSAYRYPKEYGKRSPSFARATSIDWGENKHLYVAGTASIVGHKSCHPDSPSQQIQEIQCNLDSLLDQYCILLNKNAEKGNPDDVLILKTYIRNAELLPLVKKKMEERLGCSQSNLYLIGEICRKELLLEVEGVWSINSSDCVAVGNRVAGSESND